MKTTITVGQSVQVFNIGQPEFWNRVTVSREYEGDIDEQLEIDNVFKVVEAAHKVHSQSMVDSQVAPQKKKMDIVVLRQYEDAVRTKNEKVIADLLKVYDVIA